MTRPTHRRRLGFTLIELLVVIVIIAILIGLLIPAIAGAVRTAKAAAVSAEISQLSQAIASFKDKYGDYFPSRVILTENGSMSTGSTLVVPSGGGSSGPNDITEGVLATRTVTAFRKFWPRVQFSSTGVFASNSTTWYDFNGNGTYDAGTYVLQGNECLTFFLGGVPLNANGVYSMIGFGTSPTNPFTHGIVGTSPMYGANRTTPLYEFNASRLTLTNSALQSSYGSYGSAVLIPSQIPGYLDSLGSQSPAQNFYVYFSTNVGSGYDPNDVNFNETDPIGTTAPTMLQFPTLLPVTNPTGLTVNSPSPNPYTSSALVNVPNVAYFQPQSFQIISPGADGVYGVGGVYTPNAVTSTLPLTGEGTMNSGDPSIRSVEGDNITNFHNGRLN